jgi:hypothetical protein
MKHSQKAESVVAATRSPASRGSPAGRARLDHHPAQERESENPHLPVGHERAEAAEGRGEVAPQFAAAEVEPQRQREG